MNVVASDSSGMEQAGALARLQGLLLDAASATGAVAELAEVARDLIRWRLGPG